VFANRESEIEGGAARKNGRESTFLGCTGEGGVKGRVIPNWLNWVVAGRGGTHCIRKGGVLLCRATSPRGGRNRETTKKQRSREDCPDFFKKLGTATIELGQGQV